MIAQVDLLHILNMMLELRLTEIVAWCAVEKLNSIIRHFNLLAFTDL